MNARHRTFAILAALASMQRAIPIPSVLIVTLVVLSTVAGTAGKVSAEDLPFHPTFMRSNAGWHVNLQLFEPVKEILVAKGEEETFRSTGFLQTVDRETRLPQPNPSITLVEATPVRIKLVTPDGRTLGPYPVTFDPLEQLQAQGKQSLETTQGSWLGFRTAHSSIKPKSYHYVYFTHLAVYRCAIREVRYSFDSTDLDQTFPLPACDPEEPYALPSDVDIHFVVEEPPAWAAVQLVYADGTESEVVRKPWDG